MFCQQWNTGQGFSDNSLSNRADLSDNFKCEKIFPFIDITTLFLVQRQFFA